MKWVIIRWVKIDFLTQKIEGELEDVLLEERLKLKKGNGNDEELWLEKEEIDKEEIVV